MLISKARLWLAALAVTVVAGPAESQTVAPQWPRDITVLGSLFLGRPDLPSQDRFDDTWYGTGEAAFGVGWHWTPQLKGEFEVSLSGEGRQYVYESITAPNVAQTVFRSSQHYTSTRAVSAAATWQFFDNEWVHPFMQAGMSIDLDRSRSYVPASTFFTGDPRTGVTQIVTPEERTGPHTTTSARALLGLGAKLYVTPRLFVRTDSRAVFDRKTARLSFRAGVGVDF
jgi:hypothetical protein